MPYTVKQVAEMSGVSVRTLHFYDETCLLKPAHVGTNGYRIYEEPQLLTLQQILFYRELGFELKRIREILGRADFEKVAALESHREVLQTNLARTRTLIETIDKTIEHLKGIKPMKTEDMFAGFSVAAGQDRFGENIKLDGDPVDCKLSGRDTDGAMCIFEAIAGWPLHLHHEQDEWIYVMDGVAVFEVGGKRFRLGPGESVFIPRKVAHAGGGTGKVINVYQPAGKMEEFFREVNTHQKELPTREDVVHDTYTKEHIDTLHRLFSAHGMELLGPPLKIE
jgi:DNA-binding transcriptional MerR regulator